MRPVAPRLELGWIHVEEDLVEADDAKAVVYARFIDPESGFRVITSRWRLTDAERARIAAGEDLYLYEIGPKRELLLTAGPYRPDE